ncbi:hypothetical protein MNBD_GAMMA12-1527 [hydrothermal vent metagenome]|uniref:Uncharacterized protein n=1 Tax=hydrothermal vent metagenome TaxID=652676 RepID=A0A3B0YZE1_9ZZZZ
MRKILVIWIISVFLLTACGGHVRFSNDEGQRKAIIAKHYKFKTVKITYNSKAKRKLRKYPGYKSHRLMKKLSGYLNKEGLISANSAYTLEVHVTDIFLRSKVEAFLLPISNPDKIKTIVMVKDSSGKTIETFRVESSYALGGATSLVLRVRTSYLFKNLSQLLSDVFTGKKREADF